MGRVAYSRPALAAGLLLVVLVVGVVVAAGGSGGGGAGKPAHARLKLERAMQPQSGYEEVLVSLPNQRLNNLGTNRGAKSVLLRCFDEQGRVTIRQRWPWPLLVEYGYPPHIHQPAVAKVLDRLRSCRLTGEGVDFVGRVSGPLPRFKPVR